MIRTFLVLILVVFMLPVVVDPAIAGKEKPTLQAWRDDAGTAFAIDVRGVRWTVPAACLPQRDLGSDASARDLGDKAAERDLGADRSERDLGDDAGERDLGADAGQRDLGADGSRRDLGAGVGQRDLGADGSGRDLGGRAGSRDLGTDAGERDLGSDAEKFHCTLDPRQESIFIYGLEADAVSLPAGSRFSKISAGPGNQSVRIHL
jgi:hypothetical protein